MNVKLNEEFSCSVKVESYVSYTLGIERMDICVTLHRHGLQLEYRVDIAHFYGSIDKPTLFPKRYQKLIDKKIYKLISKAEQHMKIYVENREIEKSINQKWR